MLHPAPCIILSSLLFCQLLLAHGVASVGAALGARRGVRRGAALLARWRERAEAATRRRRALTTWRSPAARRVFKAWRQRAAVVRERAETRVAAAQWRLRGARALRWWRRGAAAAAAQLAWVSSWSDSGARSKALRWWRRQAAAVAAAATVAGRTALKYAMASVAAWRAWAAHAAASRRRQGAAWGLQLMRLARTPHCTSNPVGQFC